MQTAHIHLVFPHWHLNPLPILSSSTTLSSIFIKKYTLSQSGWHTPHPQSQHSADTDKKVRNRSHLWSQLRLYETVTKTENKQNSIVFAFESLVMGSVTPRLYFTVASFFLPLVILTTPIRNNQCVFFLSPAVFYLPQNPWLNNFCRKWTHQ